jgi:hypothetical protein
MFVAVLATACGRSEPTGFTLHVDKVERINECHVNLDFSGGKDGTFVGLRFACDVPSSAQNEKNWWGDQTQPLAFTMDVGDCLNLNMTFYCLEEIEPGRSASFKPMYKMRRKGHVIEQIREGRKYLAD